MHASVDCRIGRKNDSKLSHAFSARPYSAKVAVNKSDRHRIGLAEPFAARSGAINVCIHKALGVFKDLLPASRLQVGKRKLLKLWTK